MTTKSESHTSANKKVESSRLKHLHVTVQESSQKPSANDAELSTSDDQNRQRKQRDYMTNYRAKRLAAEHMDKQTQNTTVRDTEITIRHQTAHLVNNVNLIHTYGQKEAERHKTLATERIYGSSIHASIKTFHEKIQYGCIFVCSVCMPSDKF